MKLLLKLLSILLCIALTACGGSGSETVTTPPPSNVSLSGKLTYDHVLHANNSGLDYNNIIQSNIRGATVELLNFSATTIINVTKSDENGNYSFSVPTSTNYVVRVKAEVNKLGDAPTWDFAVVDNTNDQALYAMDSVIVEARQTPIVLDINAPSGWTGTSYTNSRVAAPFAIIDSIYEAKEKVLAVDSTVIMPPLKLNWSVNNIAVSGDLTAGQITTSHFNGTDIYLLGDENSDTDEYDGHVIVHEWGHYFEDRFSRSDSIGGAHSSSDRLDMRVALGEGWGNALSGIVTDDPIYRDSFGSGQSVGFQIDVESSSSSSVGWYSESSVALLIYDFYDANNDGADTLSLGFAPLYNLMISGQKNTLALTSVFSFVNQLKNVSPVNIAVIDSMLAAQNIVVTDDFGSGESNTGGDARNIPIYQVLPVGGSVEVCSYASNGLLNKLGNRKYLILDIASSGSYSITAVGQTTGDDPDFFLFSQGSLVFRGDIVGNESITRNINSGRYVMEVYEFGNIQTNPRDTCIDVAISAN